VTTTDDPEIDAYETTEATVFDPAAKTRAVVAGILIAAAWLISAATTVLLVVYWPVAQTGDDATGTVIFGTVLATLATWFITRNFIND
jgi:hypothetical protein